MGGSQKQYKLSYLWYYAINVGLVISVLFLRYWNPGMPKLVDRLESGLICMGIWMLLPLWGRAFEVNAKYKGKYALDSRVTRLLTFALVIVEAMTLYYSGFDHPEFFKPCLRLTVIWLAGFIGCMITNKDFIVKRLSTEVTS